MNHRAHVIRNHDGDPNHHFLNQAKTLLAKLNAVPGVIEIESSVVYHNHKKVASVAAIQERKKDQREDQVVVRYFASHLYQDMTVTCDVLSLGRVEEAVNKYAENFASGRNKRRLQRRAQDRELEDYRRCY